jgi:hypothetical protein
VRIELLRTAVECRTERRISLVTLVALASRGRHNLIVVPDGRAVFDDWLSSRNEEERDTFRRAINHAKRRHARFPSTFTVQVGDPDRSDWGSTPPVLTLDDAVALWMTPLEVLVEDESSDGGLLDALVPPTHRRNWKTARSRDFVRWSNAGGVTNVARRLEDERSDGLRRLRTVVITDSDTTSPWLTSSEEYERCTNNLPDAVRKAVEAARAANIRIRVLSRRMAENYIPPPAIATWAKEMPATEEQHRHIEVYSRLPARVQRHHHLKDGIPKAEDENYNVSRKELRDLKVPLGNSVWRACKYANEVMCEQFKINDELGEIFHFILGAL